MSFTIETNNQFSLQFPPCYIPSDSNIHHSHKNSLAMRVFYAALPFIALHKPFGRTITLTMDSIRAFSSFGSLVEYRNCKELLKTFIAVAALVGTFFMHPLGLCISSLYAVGCDLTNVLAQLQIGHSQEAIFALLSMTQHLFYIGTMVTGSIEIIALFIVLNMVLEIYRSRKEFQNGNLLEGSSHLLMSFVRFSQAIPYAEKVAFKHNLKSKNHFKNLTNTVAKIRDRAAISLYSTARIFINPVWSITNRWIETISLYKNDNTTTIQKVISSTNSIFSSLVLLPFALGGLAVGQIFHFSAFLMCTTPYIHIKTNTEIKNESDSLSVFQLNCCLTAGGFSRLFGGTILSNDQRVLEITKMIRENNPDIVCLQEVSDIKDALHLYKELSKDYSEFYLNMGSTPFILQNNSGLFVASKFAIEGPQLYSFSDISGTESMVNKCFFLFSIKNANFINTHLSPSSDDLNPTEARMGTRSQEQQRIFSVAETRSSENNKPTFVTGDFNINWNSEEYQKSLLFNVGKDHYNQGREEVENQEETAETDYLIKRNWKYDKDAQAQKLIIDYFLSLFTSNTSVTITSQKIATYDIDHPERAISDHSALFSVISG